MIGMPAPPLAAIAARPPSNIAGSAPSPVMPSVPAAIAPRIMVSANSSSPMSPPKLYETPVIGAARIGMPISCPNSCIEVSTDFTWWMVRMLNLIFARASILALNELPLPTPPTPGTSPAQATPLQIGQTRQ